MPQININNELDKRFRDKINERLGMKRGNLQIATEQAIEDWIKKVS